MNIPATPRISGLWSWSSGLWSWRWLPEYPPNSPFRTGPASSREEAAQRLREDQALWNAQRAGKADS